MKKLNSNIFYDFNSIDKSIEVETVNNNENILKIVDNLLKAYSNVRSIETQATTQKRQRSIRRHLNVCVLKVP